MASESSQPFRTPAQSLVWWALHSGVLTMPEHQMLTEWMLANLGCPPTSGPDPVFLAWSKVDQALDDLEPRMH